jgi:hypothetical protein
MVSSDCGTPSPPWSAAYPIDSASLNLAFAYIPKRYTNIPNLFR